MSVHMDFLPEGVCVSVFLSAEGGSHSELFITAMRGAHGSQSKEFNSISVCHCRQSNHISGTGERKPEKGLRLKEVLSKLNKNKYKALQR